MSPRISNEPERLALSYSQPRHISMMQGMSSMASRSLQDDELSNHDTLSLCSNLSHGTPQDIKDWNMNTTDSLEQAISKDSPHVHMLSFSMSQPLMASTVGPSDVMYAGVDFPAVPDLQDNELPQDFYSFVDLSSMDNDVCGVQANTPDDCLSVAHSSHTEDGQLMASHKPWNMLSDSHYPGTTLDQLSSSIFQTVPVSPPLTEASNDISVTSSCSHAGYPSFMAADDSYLTSPIGLNPAEPLFPNTPLSEKDVNRTIRPSKPTRRAALHNLSSHIKAEEFFPPLPVRDNSRQRSKDGAEARNPREHHYYALSTHSDGKYYCPFTNGEKPCNHPPTTQKCAYHKYLDSHLKPYRCKVPACMDAQLRFSSNACLFRHEREAHGLHGHGDNPHLCLWEGCERSVPGYGFPRRWNLYDHMRRVHDYASSERHSSPEASPTSAAPKRKESNRRRKGGVIGPTPAPAMKRTGSLHSRSGSMHSRSGSSVKSPLAQHGQRLHNAEQNYYKCRSRLLEDLACISPQDITLHDKVNASLQELYTLGLTYRHLEASQTVSHMPTGLPA